MTCSFSKLPPLPYGTLIGKVLIDGIELEVFSNYGSESKPHGNPPEIWKDLHGEYLGYKHHCVSLVRRYLYFKTGKNFAQLWNDGDAKDWYANAEVMGLEQIPKAKNLQEGDLICFDKGVYNIGHIGFVQSVENDKIFITHQNIAQNENDINHCLCFDSLNFDGLIFQGGLRVPE